MGVLHKKRETTNSIHENKIPVQLFQYAIDIIRERSNGKKDYSDFKSSIDSVSFIPYVDMYIYIINSMDISECIDCIEGIKTGWTYIRNFLPVVFELNPSLLEDKYDGEDLVERIESNISLNIPSETVDDFDKMKDYYKNNNKKLEEINSFIDFHTKMGLVTDEIDMNIVNLVNSYKEALYNLIEFNTQDNFEFIQQLRNEEI